MLTRISAFILSLIALPSLVQGAQVRLVDRIAVDEPPITLGKIAAIEGATEKEKQTLLQLEVGDMPSVGRTRVISAFRIKNELQKAGLHRVSVKGMQSTVFVQTRIVPESELQDLIQDWVRSQIPLHQEAVVDYKSLPRQWQVPAGSSVELKVDSTGKTVAGTLNLSLRAQVGDKILATNRARVDVRLYQNMAVLTRPVPRRQALEAQDVEVRRAEVTKASGMEIQDPSDLIGMVAKRDLPVGSLLSLNDFDRPILIPRGALARIVVVNDNIQLGIAGAEALQSGKKGDRILFKNPMNPKENLRATVMREGLAVIKVR